MVAHNCEIGQHNVFASQVGVAGSSSTGDYVRLGGQAGIRDHVRLNTGCSIGAKGGVTCDIPAGETWIGIPALPDADQKRQLVNIKRIPDIRDQLKTLEKQMAELQAEIARLKKNETDSIPAPMIRAAG
jgi:UDP-3-O-[3-hydroxymyristoyl] glucosamine N-acyltransferase